ncbi:MAG TPA: hypothetical protein P5571_09565 [Candidatus Krumholzibacteria bacterium]|nr:hypothetical protein [Candidatus Krumholzibacteria bacterium]HRX51599.1 hypothetical protein [Candidatus Krumholzibacteria bacterium]
MARYAVIDIGTNSVKLHVAREVHGHLSVLADEAVVTRLGEDMDAEGDLNEAAMDRTLEAVRALAARADALGANKTVAVGTAAFRRARNADEFREMIKRRTKLTVKVLSGEEEARLAALAVRRTLELPAGKVAVADIGGGSTDVTLMTGGRVHLAESLPVGVRTLTDAHARQAPLSEDDGEDMARAIRDVLGDVDLTAGTLVLTGGTASTLAAIRLGLKAFDPARVHGLRLDRQDVARVYDRLAGMTLPERRAVPGLPADRADVMPAGAALALALCTAAGVDALTVCSCGLRHGVLADRFLG